MPHPCINFPVNGRLVAHYAGCYVVAMALPVAIAALTLLDCGSSRYLKKASAKAPITVLIDPAAVSKRRASNREHVSAAAFFPRYLVLNGGRERCAHAEGSRP